MRWLVPIRSAPAGEEVRGPDRAHRIGRAGSQDGSCSTQIIGEVEARGTDIASKDPLRPFA
jgi:hypothetical protein